MSLIDCPGCKRLAAHLGLLAYAAVFCLSAAGDGLAFERRAPAAGRLVAARPLAPNSGRNAGPTTPGIAGAAARFTDIPPRGKTRFVSNEVVFQAPSNVSVQAVDAAARRLLTGTMTATATGVMVAALMLAVGGNSDMADRCYAANGRSVRCPPGVLPTQRRHLDQWQ
jgi:hypothetical protein